MSGSLGALSVLLVLALPLAAQDDKLPVRLLGQRGQASAAELLALGQIWQVTECCGWTGSWTRKAGTNVFTGAWKHTNGTPVSDEVTLVSWNKLSGEVQLRRKGNNGIYRGFLDAQGRITRGTASWYPAGATWSAAVYASASDEKGRVTIRVPR